MIGFSQEEEGSLKSPEDARMTQSSQTAFHMQNQASFAHNHNSILDAADYKARAIIKSNPQERILKLN